MLTNLPSALCVMTAVLGLVSAYPFQERFASLPANVDCEASPTALSYHIHVTYMMTNDDQVSAVSNFRDRTEAEFADLLGKDPVCQGTVIEPSGRYDNGRLCMIYDHNITNGETLGPFTVGEWSMFVPTHYLTAVTPWFLQNRGDFSVLVHPNTGCEYEDHSAWAQWAGSPWNMDMSIFTRGVQTNEFGEMPGNAHNPTCIAEKGLQCSHGDVKSAGYGPAIACCNGLTCGCDSADGVCYCN